MKLELTDKFTSDLHFGHRNILNYCPRNRPWKTMEELEEGLLNCLKANLSGERLFVLGDMFFNNTYKAEDMRRVIEQIPAEVFVVPGNHDYGMKKAFKNNYDLKCTLLDSTIHCYLSEYSDISISLSHYPPGKSKIYKNMGEKFQIYLFGHIHGSISAHREIDHDGPEFYGENYFGLDVGFDYIGKPISLQDIVTRAIRFNPSFL